MESFRKWLTEDLGIYDFEDLSHVIISGFIALLAIGIVLLLIGELLVSIGFPGWMSPIFAIIVLILSFGLGMIIRYLNS